MHVANPHSHLRMNYALLKPCAFSPSAGSAVQHMDDRRQWQHSPPRPVCRLHGQLRAVGPVHGVHPCQHPGRPDARHRRTSRHLRARMADFLIPAGVGCQGRSVSAPTLALGVVPGPHQRAAALGPKSCPHVRAVFALTRPRSGCAVAGCRRPLCLCSLEVCQLWGVRPQLRTKQQLQRPAAS